MPAPMGINRSEGRQDARIGIIAAGKAWQDLNQALAGMGYRDGKIGNMPHAPFEGRHGLAAG